MGKRQERVSEIQTFETTPEALKAYSPRRYNILEAPMIGQPTPCFRIIATVLKFRAGTEDTYRLEEGYALAKQALLSLAHAAGIRYGRTRIDYDNDGSPVATVRESWQNAPGNWVQMPGVYALNEQARISAWELMIAEAASEDEQARLRENLKDRQEMWEKFGEAMAETGALLRPIRAFLGVKHIYTAKELRRYFVVFRIQFTPEDDEALQIAQKYAAAVALADLFDTDEGPHPPDDVVKMARALLKQAAPGPDLEDEEEAQTGIQEYNGRRIELRTKILEAGKHRMLLDGVEMRGWVRQQMNGKALEDLTITELLRVLDLIRASPILAKP